MSLTGYYSVVRYVPDIIRDEGVNIGVVLQVGVEGESNVVYHFTENFQRAAKIDPDLTTNILERNVRHALDQIIEESESLELDQIITNHSGGKIQFTQPRLTLVEESNIKQEIRELYEQFVWEEIEARKIGVTETKLRQKVVAALRREGINGERVKVNRPSDPVRIKGRRFNHTFDMSIQLNGHPDFIRCLSFDVEHHESKLESAKALIFDATDIRANRDDVRVMSILYPPKTQHIAERMESFKEAQAILQDERIPAFNFEADSDWNALLRALKQ
jgi:hypothetical protein